MSDSTCSYSKGTGSFWFWKATDGLQGPSSVQQLPGAFNATEWEKSQGMEPGSFKP